MRRPDNSLLLGRRALREVAEMIVAVDAGVMTVVPENANGVVANGFDGLHFQFGLVDAEGIGIGLPLLRRGAVGAGAGGAGAFAAQEFEGKRRVGAIDPIDFDSFRLADGDVFRFGLRLVVGTHSG